MASRDPSPPPEGAHKPRQRCSGASAWSSGEARRSAGSVWRYQGKHATVWRIRYRDASGRRVLETLGPEPDWTRRRAEAELRARLVDVTRDGYHKPQSVRFADYAHTWLTDALPARGLKPTTLTDYRGVVHGHLIPAVGAVKLEDLAHHPELVDRYTAQKLRAGLSPKTVRNHLLILNTMLKQAQRWRLITRNPVPDADKPRYHPPDIQILTQAEIGRLWAAYQDLATAATDDPGQNWWRLAQTITFVALGTAMRRGELLGLRWGDVQLLDSLLHVRQALVAGRITTPKSRAGRRTIHLGPRTLQLLAGHYEHSRYRTDPDLVFCHPHLGTPLDPGHLINTHIKPALTAAGITKPFRPFHDLRHTALTHEAAAGNPHAYIQHKAGHSQGATTERYIHAAQTAFPGAALLAEARLFGAGSVAKHADSRFGGGGFPSCPDHGGGP